MSNSKINLKFTDRFDKPPKSKNRVVTVSTHTEHYGEYFDESCKRFGIEPVILGMGQKWEGYGTKLAILKKYIDGCDPEDVILFVDRFDLIFLKPIEPLFDFYRTQKEASGPTPLLYIATESRDLIGLNTLYSKIHWGHYNDSMLNTGSYIATAGMIQNMLAEVFSDTNNQSTDRKLTVKDDQELIVSYLRNNTEVQVMLDNNRRFLVHSVYRLDIGKNIRIEDKKLYYENNGTVYQPYLIHRNGSASMQRLLTKLGYDMSKNIIPSSFPQRLVQNHIPFLYHKILNRLPFIKAN